VETVSRTLTDLRQSGVIQFDGVRSVRICDRGALERASEGSGARNGAGLHAHIATY
jgi:hypothetical protein